MRSERWQRVKSVFLEALELESEARASFLAEIGEEDPDLLREVASLLEADERSDGFLEWPAPRHVRDDRLAPGRKIGPYKIERELGSGGMGQVYLATRTDDFRQQVAIKLLHKGLNSEELIRRFHVERQILADLRHPNIARLYDGGATESGRPYLVMEYVEGRPFDAYCRERRLSLPQKLALFGKVCSAVHFAHQNRVVHQDLKPANVLVTDRGEPLLLDFGIAKILEAEASPGNRSALRPMTHAFASPEQIADEPITTASDIYALGAFLHQLLTGSPPPNKQAAFTSFDASIPEDIAVITRKCLEQDQRDRYDSARALEVDLDLFLKGSPIQARSHELFYVLGKKMFRRRFPLALAAMALLMLFGVLTWAVRQRILAEERIRMARIFEQKAERIEAAVRHVHMLPPHDIRPDRVWLHRELNGIQALTHSAARHTRDLGHYALGRGFLALGRFEEARAQLSLAWENGSREPQLALALGRALGALYQQKTREAERIHNPEERRMRMADIEARFLAPAVDFLQKYSEASGQSAAFSLGLLAFYEKEYEEAMAGARMAYQRLPWLYEARELEGDIYLAWANEKRNRGDFEAAMADYRAAERAYEAAATIGPSLHSVYAALGDLGQAIMQARIYGPGGDPLPAFELGMRGCQRLLEVDPDSCEAFRLQSALFKRLSEFERAQGLDPRPNLDAAIKTATRALELCPSDAESLKQLGAANYELGRYRARHGGDPKPFFEKANDAYDQAIHIDPDYQSHNRRGLMLRALALHEWERGGDPKNLWQEGISAFEAAMRAHPGMVGAPSNLGLLWNDRADFLLERGEDPEPFLNRSIASLEHALTISPKHAGVTYNLARGLLARARHRFSRGLDADPQLNQALETYQRVIQLRPDVSVFLSGLGDALLLHAQLAWSRGEDPDHALAGAHNAYLDALAINPREPQTISNRGEALLVQATFHTARGLDPTDLLKRALMELSLALSLNANLPEAPRVWAEAVLLQARHQWEQGLDPGGKLELAEEKLAASICLNSNDFLAHLAYAEAFLFHARSAWQKQQDPRPWFHRAKDSLEKAAVLNDMDAASHLAIARWANLRAQWAVEKGEPTQAYLDMGKTAVAKILTDRPEHWEALAMRGMLFLLEAEAYKSPNKRGGPVSQAARDLDQALAGNQNLVWEYGAYLERAKAYGSSLTR